MKIKSRALLLIVVSSFMLLFSPLSSVPTMSAQQEKVLDQSVDFSDNQAYKPVGSSPCGTRPLEEAEKQEVEKALERFGQENMEAANASGSVTIQVYFHVINNGVEGNVPESVLDEQIRILNWSFSGVFGGPNTPFRFQKVGVTRIHRPEWYRMRPDDGAEVDAKSKLRQGGATTLNFYTIGDNRPTQCSTPQPYPFGFARLPSRYADDPCMDGVVVPFKMLPFASNEIPEFNQGDIGVHEVGHWLGLEHTFHGGCSSTNDGIADTPAQDNEDERAGCVQSKDQYKYTGKCPSDADTCPDLPKDPSDNFMNNTSDTCKRQFTPGQSAHMYNMYRTYRQFSAPPRCYVSLFNTQVPNEVGLSAGGVTWEQATQVSTSKRGRITHIRFYKSPGEDGVHKGWLWNEAGFPFVSNVIFTAETDSGWQEQLLSSPRIIFPGDVFRVSYNVNRYGAKTFAGLNTPITNSPLTAHTSYYTTPKERFPNTNSGSILFADIRFNSSQ